MRCPRVLDADAAAALARIIRPHRLGFARLDARLWGELDAPLRATVLGRLVATVGGRAYPVAAAALGRVVGATLAVPATLVVVFGVFPGLIVGFLEQAAVLRW